MTNNVLIWILIELCANICIISSNILKIFWNFFFCFREKEPFFRFFPEKFQSRYWPPVIDPPKTLYKGGIREGGGGTPILPLLPTLTPWLSISYPTIPVRYIGWQLPNNFVPEGFTYGYQHFIHNGMWITLFVYSNFVLVYTLTLWEQTIRYEYSKNRTKRYTIRYRYLCP